tara:strand:+ start:362 stop:601 length:240 start_codon:yes stop_codon:yes gene_type:complete
MKTKINPTIEDYKKIASLAKKLDQIDKQSSQIEKEFITIFNKLNKTVNFTKKVRQGYYSTYRSIVMKRIKNFKKLLGLN